jgi:glycosyltransferase involved in cell wall biosynthesis
MGDRLKVLFLTHNYPRWDGDYSGVFLELLARRLAEFEIVPIVLAPHDSGAAEFEEKNGVRIYRFRYEKDESAQTLAYRGEMQKAALGSWRGVMQLRRFLNSFQRRAQQIVKEEQIDIVAGHWLVPTGIVMKRLRRSFRGPMVLSSHGTDLRLMHRFNALPYYYLKRFCHRLSKWTVVSSWLRSQVLLLDPGLEPLVEVLPLPHDESIFYVDNRIERDPNLVVAVTRFTEQKRVPLLIRAFAHVTTRIPEARLEIYGSGPLQTVVEAEITAHGLRNQVSVFDPVPQTQLREVYNRAAVVVLNSYHEGFGLALSEAMLCGAAVVGTRSGGITDIIEHQKRGLLVELDAVEPLAKAISTLLLDPAFRARLSRAGEEYARNTYASRPLAARYAAILRDSCKTQ